MSKNPRQPSQILLLASVTVLAAASAVIGLAQQAGEFGPRVGDMVRFDPAQTSLFDSSARLVAGRPEQASCVVDVGMVQRSGGSLVVEQRATGGVRVYRAHWAGPRTSEKATDCGPDADLVLSSADMNVLAMAASGSATDTASSLRLR